MNECRKIQRWFSDQNTKDKPGDIGRQWSVGIRMRYVDHAEQLRKEDDVDQIRAEIPKNVDGRDKNTNSRRTRSNQKDANAHH